MSTNEHINKPTYEELEAEYNALIEKEALLSRQKCLQDNLGYKFAHKIYTYQREFIESQNKMNLLVAANQIGKSSSLILRACEKAFSTDEQRVEWYGDKFVPGRDKLLIWYFYPDYKTATTAFETTWKKYLPKGPYLEDPTLSSRYGWKAVYGANHTISEIQFREGIIQFKVYGQSSLNLQSATVWEVLCDEELPFFHYAEIKSRMNYTDGYFSMGFTATLGEHEWYLAMERQGCDDELFPNAKKWNVSLYDCMRYEDGTPSLWTKERITAVSNQYGTKEEVEKRVMGRFVVDSNQLLMSGFRQENIIEPIYLPDDWEYYAGMDYGMGGKNHKSAIVFVAVKPTHDYVVTFAAWREDNMPTPPEMVLNQYLEMKKKINKNVVCFYDYAAVDLEKIINTHEVAGMYRAVKKPEEGIALLNALMKNNMLQFFNHGDVPKLFQEFRLIRVSQDKKHRRDDLNDALRYSLSKIEFDFSHVDNSQLITPDRYRHKIESKVRDYTEGNRTMEGFRLMKENKEKNENKEIPVDEELDFSSDIFSY